MKALKSPANAGSVCLFENGVWLGEGAELGDREPWAPLFYIDQEGEFSIRYGDSERQVR